MNLSQALRVPQSSVAFVGSGGKTTAIFQLARELSTPTIVTATTHLHVNQIILADSHFVVNTIDDLADLEGHLHGVVLVTGSIQQDRTTGLPFPILSRLQELCRSHNLPLLIEADGSRQKMLKAPADHEPAIPDGVGTVVVVAGLSGLGKPLTEKVVHRPHIFTRLSGLEFGEIINLAALSRALTHPTGGIKNIPQSARRVLLLNQADTPELQGLGKSLAEMILTVYDSAIIASLRQFKIHAVYEKVAGIVLAAGGSSRFGQPKQLLVWHGKTFVRSVVETALLAGLSPVVVVTGADSEQVENALAGLPVQIIHNKDWRIGQSSSIRAGLVDIISPGSGCNQFAPTCADRGGKGKNGEWIGRAGATIFLLVDQPQISPVVLEALIDEHSRTLAPIVAPLVDGRRTNPVLFDRTTFQDLMALTGDVGGRALFSKHQVDFLPWHDGSLLNDVDTPEDYLKLVNG